MTQKERNRCIEEQKKMLFATAKYITQKDYSTGWRHSRMCCACYEI